MTGFTSLPKSCRRFERMHRHVAGVKQSGGCRRGMPALFLDAAPTCSPEQLAEFQEHWDSLIGDDQSAHQVRWIPSAPKPPKTHRQRRMDRMRKHTRDTLIHALRPNGTFEDLILVKTCKAYWLLPSDVGVPRDRAPRKGSP